VDSSLLLRNKKDLIEEFVESLSTTSGVEAAWAAFIAAKRAEELDRIITEEALDREATDAFVEAAFRDGAVQPTDSAITKILPPVSSH
jgi:type I restriction enzyme R subunit